jgi:hypothetical protein
MVIINISTRLSIRTNTYIRGISKNPLFLWERARVRVVND